MSRIFLPCRHKKSEMERLPRRLTKKHGSRSISEVYFNFMHDSSHICFPPLPLHCCFPSYNASSAHAHTHICTKMHTHTTSSLFLISRVFNPMTLHPAPSGWDPGTETLFSRSLFFLCKAKPFGVMWAFFAQRWFSWAMGCRHFKGFKTSSCFPCIQYHQALWKRTSCCNNFLFSFAFWEAFSVINEKVSIPWRKANCMLPVRSEFDSKVNLWWENVEVQLFLVNYVVWHLILWPCLLGQCILEDVTQVVPHF